MSVVNSARLVNTAFRLYDDPRATRRMIQPWLRNCITRFREDANGIIVTGGTYSRTIVEGTEPGLHRASHLEEDDEDHSTRSIKRSRLRQYRHSRDRVTTDAVFVTTSILLEECKRDYCRGDQIEGGREDMERRGEGVYRWEGEGSAELCGQRNEVDGDAHAKEGYVDGERECDEWPSTAANYVSSKELWY
jgi:hypothetical protein